MYFKNTLYYTYQFRILFHVFLSVYHNVQKMCCSLYVLSYNLYHLCIIYDIFEELLMNRNTLFSLKFQTTKIFRYVYLGTPISSFKFLKIRIFAHFPNPPEQKMYKGTWANFLSAHSRQARVKPGLTIFFNI